MKLHTWIATASGTGFLRPGPGTWGSLLAIPLAFPIFHYLGVIEFIFCIGIVSAIGHWAAKLFDRDAGGHDNKMIVIDEVAGQWVALLPALILYGTTPLTAGTAFIMFRLFDIWKPWPVSWADRLPGATGVMADDLLAGTIAGFISVLCIEGLHHVGF